MPYLVDMYLYYKIGKSVYTIKFNLRYLILKTKKKKKKKCTDTQYSALIPLLKQWYQRRVLRRCVIFFFFFFFFLVYSSFFIEICVWHSLYSKNVSLQESLCNGQIDIPPIYWLFLSLKDINFILTSYSVIRIQNATQYTYFIKWLMMRELCREIENVNLYVSNVFIICNFLYFFLISFIYDYIVIDRYLPLLTLCVMLSRTNFKDDSNEPLRSSFWFACIISSASSKNYMYMYNDPIQQISS